MSKEAQALRASLGRADENMRRHILYNVPDSQDPELALVVADYLGDPSPAVCEAAVATLARAARGAAAAAAQHLYALEPAERGYALETLIQLRTHALPTVMALLGDSDRDVRKYAVEALAGIHAANTLPLLTAALQDSDVTVAAAAAEALEALGLPSAIPALASAVEHGSYWLRIAALNSLGIIGGPEALQAICSVSDNYSATVLAAAAMAASRASPADTSSAIAFLARLLPQDKTTLREVVVETLGPLLTRNVSLTSEQRKVIAAAAQPALGSPRPTVRAAAVAAAAGAVAGKKLLIDGTSSGSSKIRACPLSYSKARR